MNLVELLIYAAAWEIVFRHRHTMGAILAHHHGDSDGGVIMGERARVLHAAVIYIDACRE